MLGGHGSHRAKRIPMSKSLLSRLQDVLVFAGPFCSLCVDGREHEHPARAVTHETSDQRCG